MDYVAWPCPAATGDTRELALCFPGDTARLLVLPPLFDEANKLRRQIVATLRLLSARGIGSVLPDLPGLNESLAPHRDQTLAAWRAAATAAAAHFDASHVLALRSGCWLAPAALPGWLVAASKPPHVLRALLRARTIAAREAGRSETIEGLMAAGAREGLEVAGWDLGALLLQELEHPAPVPGPGQRSLAQETLGGPGLWLRAEPGFDPAQADALAALVAADLAA